MAKNISSILGEEIAIGPAKYDNTFSDDISIDKTNLDVEFEEHSERFSWYAGLSEVSESAAERAKFKLEVLYAQLDVEKRQAFHAGVDPSSKLKLTEKMVENEIIGDSRYQTAMFEYLEAKKTAGLLNRAREAFNHRKDMLVQLGSNSRVGDPKVKSEFARAVVHSNKDSK